MKRVVANRRFLAFLAVSLPWWFLFTQLYASFPIRMFQIASEADVPALILANGAVGFVFMPGSIVIFERVRCSRLLPYTYLTAALLYALYATVPISSAQWWFLAGTGGYHGGTWLFLTANPMLTLGTFGAIGLLGAALAAWFAATENRANDSQGVYRQSDRQKP